MELYTAEAVKEHARLSRGGLLLIALMQGSDYTVSSHPFLLPALFFMIFAEPLHSVGSLGVMLRLHTGCLSMASVIVSCRQRRIYHPSNSRSIALGGAVNSAMPLTLTLTATFSTEIDTVGFPNPVVIALYVHPVTSWSPGRRGFVGSVISCQPDLSAIADYCMPHFFLALDDLPHRLNRVCSGAVTRALLQVSLLLLGHPSSFP